jgi:hypothetical protein
MLSVTCKPYMLSVAMLNVVMLSVVAPFKEQKIYFSFLKTSSLQHFLPQCKHHIRMPYHIIYQAFLRLIFELKVPLVF